jgi:putative transposase
VVIGRSGKETEKNPPKRGWERVPAAYLAPGVQAGGTEEILGLWIEQTGTAKFWLHIMIELKNRGMGDIHDCHGGWIEGFP